MDDKLSEKLVVAVERLAAANEAIVQMANEERQANYQGGPPYCPHCGTMAPNISVPAAKGNMGEHVLAATCGNCGQTFLAIAEGWRIFRDRTELEEAGQQ